MLTFSISCFILEVSQCESGFSLTSVLSGRRHMTTAAVLVGVFTSQFNLWLPVWLLVWYVLVCRNWCRRRPECSEHQELFSFLPVVLSAAKHQMTPVSVEVTACRLNSEEIKPDFQSENTTWQRVIHFSEAGHASFLSVRGTLERRNAVNPGGTTETCFRPAAALDIFFFLLSNRVV